jgi:hypothetical protein
MRKAWRICSEMRSGEMKWNLKRDVTGLRCQEFVAAQHRRLAHTLQAHSIFAL